MNKSHISIFAGNMLTEEETRFIKYWEKARGRKKRSFRQLALGLPLGVIIVVLIFANFLTGWFKRAEMMIRTEPSLIFVMLGAALLIVTFIAVFSIYHKWDRNEQLYQELLAKKDHPSHKIPEAVNTDEPKS
jgi:uncharacterized BrkB/YihY/UPF0761 family membrane protein